MLSTPSRRRSLAVLALGAAAATQLVAVPAAFAAGDAALIEIQRTANNVFVDGDTASVTGKYRCSPEVAMTHVWVSVKQGGEDLEGPHSSVRATSMYDTNVSWQGVEPTLTCDGEWQHLTVELGRYADKEALQRGEAWLQFCMYAMTADGVMGDATENSWASVKTRGQS